MSLSKSPGSNRDGCNGWGKKSVEQLHVGQRRGRDPTWKTQPGQSWSSPSYSIGKCFSLRSGHSEQFTFKLHEEVRGLFTPGPGSYKAHYLYKSLGWLVLSVKTEKNKITIQATDGSHVARIGAGYSSLHSSKNTLVSSSRQQADPDNLQRDWQVLPTLLRLEFLLDGLGRSKKQVTRSTSSL